MKSTVIIKNVIFVNRQNIPWNEVERYLKRYVGKEFPVSKYNDVIHIAGDFPDEFSESQYTKKLRGTLAKAKANAATIIEEMIFNAENKRWIENKEKKHQKDAPGGWFRYDTYFGMPVQGSQEEKLRINMYKATLIARAKEGKLFLYDVINIKKEASTPL